MKISNDLENGLVLNLHCQSKNDDLGVHALSKGGTFEFVFLPNYWGSTPSRRWTSMQTRLLM
ncbi:s-protein like protein 3 [Quercus suber]|uniref:S-protein homolog n=1 Tax=Quercus suber TaxID=58331 RepID=A0AAW0IZM4_QUESU